MFYNKKGLLAEIKKTEQKISEKILVLEDLLDSAEKKSLISKVKNDEFFTVHENVDSKDSKTELRVLSLEDAHDSILENKDFEKTDVIDVSEMEDNEKTEELDFDELEFASEENSEDEEDDELQEESDLENEDWSLESDSIVADVQDFEEEERTLMGVKSIIQEAKQNMEKIDVTENIKIKSFKDVVLLAKKIDHLR